MTEEVPPQGKVFKNMQHAIVEALHELGPHSPHGDNSIRMRELFAKVENAPIEMGDHVENGPHRFSIFNSALCGRRSASELFERVEKPDRQGAWWRLVRNYDESIKYALEQKGMKKKKERTRQKQDHQPQPEIAHVKPQPVFKWNKVEVLDILGQLKDLAIKTSSLKEENRKLEEQLALETEEVDIMINSLREEDSENIKLAQLDAYTKLTEYRDELRNQLENAQRILIAMSDQSMELQK